MTLTPMSARDVLAAYPRAIKDHLLRQHGEAGLACPAGNTAWVEATPAPDGTWTVTGRLGEVGDNAGHVLVERSLEDPDPLYEDLANAACEPLDPALAIVSAISRVVAYVAVQARFLDLRARFPELDIHAAGGACPFQAEGTLHGLPFYFRYRHNGATLRVGGDLFGKALYSSGTDFGDGEDQGWLTDDEFTQVMSQLIDDLDRAAIWWEFPGVQASTGVAPGEPTTHGAWGHTAEEAWQRLHEPSAYLRSLGYDDDTQAQWRNEQQLQPTPVTVDDREFPDPDPFRTPQMWTSQSP